MPTEEFYEPPYGHGNQKRIDLTTVEDYTLEDYGLTVENVKSNHFGVDITDPRTGEHLPDQFYRQKIEAAVAQIEKELDLAILPRIQVEHHDFYQNDFNSNMYIHAFMKPIIQVEDIRMEFGGNTVMRYPSNWWKVYNRAGHIQMLPSVNLNGDRSGLSLASAFSGAPLIAGIPSFGTSQSMPQMFHMEYVAGMLPPRRRGVAREDEMHPDLWQLIIKMVLKEAFQQWGRLILGAGIASYSTSIDGVSQSVDTTQSAMYGGASADIVQLDSDIANLKQGLRAYYGNNLGII